MGNSAACPSCEVASRKETSQPQDVGERIDGLARFLLVEGPEQFAKTAVIALASSDVSSPEDRSVFYNQAKLWGILIGLVRFRIASAIFFACRPNPRMPWARIAADFLGMMQDPTKEPSVERRRVTMAASRFVERYMRHLGMEHCRDHREELTRIRTREGQCKRKPRGRVGDITQNDIARENEVAPDREPSDLAGPPDYNLVLKDMRSLQGDDWVRGFVRFAEQRGFKT